MNRVEANVAPQLADSVRPGQAGADRRHQAEAADAVQVERAADHGAAVSSEDVQAAAAELKQVIEVASSRDLNFNVHRETSDLYVQISDGSSGELIKQIPGEEVLALRERLQELVGLMVDETA